VVDSFYQQLLQLRETFVMQDDSGLVVTDASARPTAWQRANAFAKPS